MDNTIIRLVFVGDFCAYSPENIKMGSELRETILNSDVRVINFEGPLQRGTLHTANSFFLKQSDESPKWCIDNGFNLIGLANNHAYDFGPDGLKATVDAFNQLTVVGVGTWDEAYSIRYLTIKGYTIGFFSATSADLASLKDEWCDKGKLGCAWINHPSVLGNLKEAKQHCDYLCVIPHAGVEFMNVPLPEWRSIYRQIIDAGADAIIASHAHVPQGWEYYQGKPIFYSLGNFVFDKGTQYSIPKWYNGLMASLEISDSGIRAEALCTKLSDGIVDIDNTVESIQYLEELCAFLRNDAVYMSKVNEGVLHFYQKYEGWLLSGLRSVKIRPLKIRQLYHIFRAFIKGGTNKRVALHQIREESTRWTLQRAYKLLTHTDL